jgi:hypothetical protein
LKSAIEKLKEGGIILITVPAWQFLFSKHDEYSHHYRRYNRKQLMVLLKAVNIKIVKCHYFYTSLFIVRIFSMLLKGDNLKGTYIGWKYTEKHVKTKFLKGVLNMDFMVSKILDKIGIHLPGLSLTAICKKG